MVNTSYDVAMRPIATSGGTTTNYVQQAGYYPHGAVQYWTYGNNLWSWQTFSKLLQPYQGWATQGNDGNNWMFYAGNSFNPNETVLQQQEGYSPAGTPGVPWSSLTARNTQFAYDSLNRLNSVSDTGYARGYHYDEFGNLSVQSNSVVPLSSVTPFYNGSANPYNPATNHIVTVDANGGYDGRGNITKLGVSTVTMGYDAESNMTSTVDTGTGQSVSWVYDAEGQRAQKLIAGGSWTLYIHDAFGQLAASYNNNGVTPACVTCYLTYDMVGTPRLVTDQNENVVARHDFIPFGEEIQNSVADRNGSFGFASNVTQAFTGQESDGGTVQLDYFNARHLAAVLGRFVQPDPMNAGADIMSPQSWNAYGYVLGNPLGLIDPSGMCDVLIAGITMSPGQNSTVDSFGKNLISVFPYSRSGYAGGVGSVIFGSSDVSAAMQGILEALSQTPDGQKVNVTTISGGSGAFAAAYGKLSYAQMQRIGTINYLVPGNSQFMTPLPSGTDGTNFVAGVGNDRLIPSGRPYGKYKTVPSGCSHVAACVLQEQAQLLKGSQTSCSSPQTITQRSGKGYAISTIHYGGGGGGGSSSNSYWWWPILPAGGDADPTPITVEIRTQ